MVVLANPRRPSRWCTNSICDNNLKLFISYLSNRKQCVKINKTISSLKTIKCGVPQGTVILPIFFNIQINIVHSLPLQSEIICYADDTVMLCTGPAQGILTPRAIFRKTPLNKFSIIHLILFILAYILFLKFLYLWIGKGSQNLFGYNLLLLFIMNMH
jgi:hypothetical protein